MKIELTVDGDMVSDDVEPRMLLVQYLREKLGGEFQVNTHLRMLLDDVMSELDPERRAMLAGMLGGEGQSVITTTDLGHVPGAEATPVVRLEVSDGAVVQDPVAA